MSTSKKQESIFGFPIIESEIPEITAALERAKGRQVIVFDTFNSINDYLAGKKHTHEPGCYAQGDKSTDWCLVCDYAEKE